jgi:KipI family sensor histidine kinase inhibitor
MTIPPVPRIVPAGDAAVTFEFGETIDPVINDRVIAFVRSVDRLALPGIVETVPTYRSATIYFDPAADHLDRLIARLMMEAHAAGPSSLKPRRVDIPVLYGGEWGPDLEDVAAFGKVSIDEAVALHISVEYRVYMLGFSPGFPYMGSIPETIAMPRLPTPRLHVPAGSVGIAGSQTGIYPTDGPGGWRLIGRTPLRLYDSNRAKPFLFEQGDRVRFVSVERQEFDRISETSAQSPEH